MTEMPALNRATIRALERRSIAEPILAKLLNVTEAVARDILTGAQPPSASQIAIIRLAAVATPRDAHTILSQLDEDYEWRAIPGFERYEASVHGHIRRAAAGPGAMPGHILKAKRRRSGHLTVTLYDAEGKMQPMGVHRAVCLTFNGPPPSGGSIVCHRNDKPADNRPENLYWGTAIDNAADRRRNHRQRLLAGRSGTKLTQWVKRARKSGVISDAVAREILGDERTCATAAKEGG